MVLQPARERRFERHVVRTREHDGIHEPARHAIDRRVDQRGPDPQRDQQRELRRRERDAAADADPQQRERDGDRGGEYDQPQRALEKQIRERERIVLIQDGHRQRNGRMVSDQFDRPRRGDLVQLAEMKRGDGERGERDRPQGTPRAGLPPCRERERRQQPDEAECEQSKRRRRRHRPAVRRRVDMERRGDDADDVRRKDQWCTRGPPRASAVVADDAMDNDGG